MDDDDYNQLGVMEDSSSRISSGLWSTEEADRGLMGQGSGGGDSSLLVEAGLSGECPSAYWFYMLHAYMIFSSAS